MLLDVGDLQQERLPLLMTLISEHPHLLVSPYSTIQFQGLIFLLQAYNVAFSIAQVIQKKPFQPIFIV